MENKFYKLENFIARMKAIDINIELMGNAPWIYIRKINGKIITEKFLANHGFTVGFYPIKNDEYFEFTDISEIFKLIRKYR